MLVSLCVRSVGNFCEANNGDKGKYLEAKDSCCIKVRFHHDSVSAFIQL